MHKHESNRNPGHFIFYLTSATVVFVGSSLVGRTIPRRWLTAAVNSHRSWHALPLEVCVCCVGALLLCIQHWQTCASVTVSPSVRGAGWR